MRVVSVIVALLLAVPAFAQPSKPSADRDRDRDRDRREELEVDRFEGPVVAAHRGELLRELNDANALLDDAINRAKKDKKDRRYMAELREIKLALQEMREALNEAPQLRLSRDGRRMVVDLDDDGWRWMRTSNQWKREWDQQAPGPVVTAPPPTNPPPSRPGSNVYPISDGELRSLVATIDREGFPQSRLRVLEQAATSRYFLIQQVKTILGEFSYSGDRLKAVEILKPRILDLENGDQLYSAFEFSNDKEQLRDILRR